MKKIILLTAVLIGCMTIGLRAQDIQYGIRAGANSSNWGGESSEFFKNIVSIKNAFTTQNNKGFHVGSYMIIPLGDKFRIEPALMYSQKGQEIKQNLFQNTLINPRVVISNTSHYLDLPVLAKFFITEGFHIYGGPQVSYLVANKVKAEAGVLGLDLIDYDINYSAPLRKLDFGMVAGLGYEFSNGINLTAGYDYGLSSLDKWGRTNISNRVIKASIGYTFK